MKRILRWLLILGSLGGLGYAASGPIAQYWKERNRVTFREDSVSRGRVVSVVNSTGTVKPVRSVLVGTFVSGPVETIHVDFNDEVKKGTLLARIDPRIYKAAYEQARALLATRTADIERVKANLQQARNNEARSKSLKAENRDFISDAEMDQFKFARLALEADLIVAQSTIDQAKASLDTAQANLTYTEIRSPEDGVIIDRKIDPGQTVAATYQTPEMFTVAPDMRKEMRVFASVDEADIGHITAAQLSGQPVRFTVDAYPDSLFTGTIFQIRKSSSTTQNVVTYPVVVSAPNPDLKLLPGMTASISFQIAERKDTLRVPNAALRFFPDKAHVRTEDKKLLEGKTVDSIFNEDESATPESMRSAEEKAENRSKRSNRHVWVVDGEKLRAVPIVVGINDSKYSELVSGELKDGDKLVTGIQPKS